MNLNDSLQIALRAVNRNLGRAILTTLGVIIGVGAIIAMVSIGVGAQDRIQKELEKMGTNNLTVWPGASRHAGVSRGTGTKTSLKRSDSDAIMELPGISSVAPVIRSNALIRYRNSNWTTRIEGTTPSYQQVNNWELASGDFFNSNHVQTAANVCVLGQTVARQLFGFDNPLHKIIVINKIPCKVLGILDSKGANSSGRDLDDIALVPITTSQRRISGQLHLSYIAVQSIDTESAYNAYAHIHRLLRQRHKLPDPLPEDFRVRSRASLAKTSEENSRVFTWLLGSIATISLFVGGIGIMNIMLVSVTERTHEIGIRRALGARRKDILSQFLIESVVLSGVGGLIGVLAGIATSFAIARFSDMPTTITPYSIYIAFLFSTLVGVIFGIHPARRAANLHPIEALRHE